MADTVFRITLDKGEIQPITVPMLAQFLCANLYEKTVELYYLGDAAQGPVTLFIEQVKECGELKADTSRLYLGSAIGPSPVHIFQLL